MSRHVTIRWANYSVVPGRRPLPQSGVWLRDAATVVARNHGCYKKRGGISPGQPARRSRDPPVGRTASGPG